MLSICCWISLPFDVLFTKAYFYPLPEELLGGTFFQIESRNLVKFPLAFIWGTIPLLLHLSLWIKCVPTFGQSPLMRPQIKMMRQTIIYSKESNNSTVYSAFPQFSSCWMMIVSVSPISFLVYSELFRSHSLTLLFWVAIIDWMSFLFPHCRPQVWCKISVCQAYMQHFQNGQK